MKIINRIINRISPIAGGFSTIFLAAMILLIIVDVFLRKAFRAPILGSYEAVQYLFMIHFFGSWCFTQSKRGHVRVTLIINNLPWRLHCVLNGIYELLCAAMAGYMCYAAAVHAAYLSSVSWRSEVIKMPTSPFFWVESFCILILALLFLFDAIASFIALTDKEMAESLFKHYA